MKIAVLNPHKNFAESESARRIIAAASKSGHIAKEFQHSYEIEEYSPDFILAISHQNPKLTKFPTYGVLTAPIFFYKQTERFSRNILTYDGAFTVSETVKDWLEKLYFGARKFDVKIGYYANTCPKIKFDNEINFKKPSLAYFGTNWDGQRMGSVMKSLAKKDYMNFYGPKESWKYINQEAYKGQVPFDGKSVFNTYRKHGVGLCVYMPEFVEDGLPSNRVFEITASGAYCISSSNEFSEKIFGNNIFHFDQSLPHKKIVEQIDEHLIWVRKNPDEVKQRARQAKKIFDQQLSLETLLKNVVSYHEEALIKRGYVAKKKQEEKIAYIIRTGGRPKQMIENALDSLKNQSYKNITPIIVTYKVESYLKELLHKYKKVFPEIHHIESIPGCRSTTLWAGLNYIKEDPSFKYFGILDDDDELFPNHVQSILNCFSNYKQKKNFDMAFCYSGAIQKKNGENLDELLKDKFMPKNYHEYSRIYKYNFWNIEKLLEFEGILTSNSFLSQTKFLDEEILSDPKLDIGEGLHLFIMLSEKGKAGFNCEVSAVANLHDLGRSDYHEKGDDSLIKMSIKSIYENNYPPLQIQRSEISSYKKYKPLHNKLWRYFMKRTRKCRNFLEMKIWGETLRNKAKKKKK